MRYQRTGLTAAVLAMLAASAVAAAGPARAGLVTSCTGTASDVSIPGDLFVPVGESCELTNVTVSGNTTVRADANLILTDSALAGTLTLQGNGFADLETTTVAGASRLNGAFGLFSQGSTLTGNLTVADAGFAYSVGTTFTGNITSTGGETYLQSGRVGRNLTTSGDFLTDLYDTVVQGAVTVGNATLGSVVCTSEIDGAAAFTGASADGTVQIGAAAPVAGCGFDVFASSLTVSGNHSPVAIADSVVRGALACADNDATPTGSGNRLRGGATGQCAGLTAAAAKTTARTTAAGEDGTDSRVAGILAKISSRRSTGESAATMAGHAKLQH
jgi:hypothetical protein